MAEDHSSGQTAASLLRRWIQRCDDYHDHKCRIVPIAERPSWKVPDWVIDTRESCIVAGDSVAQYAALSYVWTSPSNEGGPTALAPTLERLMLRSDNLEDFRQPGFLSADVVRTLPMVVRDSLELVQKSDVRYLWVDCLCIVQHTETTRDRVDAMSEIYSGATFTIIAATTGGGLSGPPPTGDPVADGLRIPRPWSSRHARELHGSLLASHWATRGWTFQEHLLSKRSIVFVDETVFWDCQCSVWSPGTKAFEDNDDPKDSIGGPSEPGRESPSLLVLAEDDSGIGKVSGEVKKRETHSQALDSLSVPNFGLYIELVCRYNHRDLTYPQDALPAFSGVLHFLARGFSGGFVCGLPVLFLDTALLWQPLRKAKRRLATDTGRNFAPSAPLPSWSWIGWKCLIDPGTLISGLDYEVNNIKDGKSFAPRSSLRTMNLVDWHAISGQDRQSEKRLEEHHFLERLKNMRDDLDAAMLPEGWFCRSGLEYLCTKQAFEQWAKQSRQEQNETNGTEYFPEPPCRPVQWYFHETQKDTLYYYPLPVCDASQIATSLNNAALLSCTTTIAHLSVRRTLICKDLHKYSGALQFFSGVFKKKKSSAMVARYPVATSVIYKANPEVEDCCSVMTLEDDRGRWAGLLRVMDDTTVVDAGQSIQLVAISKGSSSLREAASTYEAVVDSHGCYSNRKNFHYHFESNTNSQQRSAGGGDELADATPKHRYSKSFRASQVRLENKESGLDLGPFYSGSSSCTSLSNKASGSLPLDWAEETYSFYNVLWVETKDGVMYRKAAGRISEHIWEQNCGVPQKITLG